MTHRSLKDSVAVAGDSDENSDLFSANRRGHDSSDGRHLLQVAKEAKTGVNDLMPPTDGEKQAHHSFAAPPDGPCGTQLRSVLAARKTTALKVRSVSTGRAVSKVLFLQTESNPSSRPTRSSSATRFTISASQTTAFPTVRSSSAPKKTTPTSASASASSHNSPPSLPLNSTFSVTRSSTPSTGRTQSRSSTPSRVDSRPTIPSVGKTRSAPNSRSSTPISRPQSTASLAATSSSCLLTRASESVTSGSSGGRILSSGRRAVSGSRAISAGPSISSHNSPPQTPLRLKARASAPRLSATITTKGTTTSSNVTRGRSNGHATDRKDSQKASSGASGIVSGKSSSADSSGFRKAICKTSLQMAIKHMDIGNGTVGRRPFSSATLYPHSMRSSSTSKAQTGSHGVADNREKCSGHGRDDDDDGRSLMKAGKAEKYDSARYDALLLVKDVKDTNWLLSIDEPSLDSDHSLLLDNGFEPPPEPFPPL